MLICFRNSVSLSRSTYLCGEIGQRAISNVDIIDHVVCLRGQHLHPLWFSLEGFQGSVASREALSQMGSGVFPEAERHCVQHTTEGETPQKGISSD